MSETVRVPTFSKVEIMQTARDASNSETWLMEPLPQEKIRTPVLVARSVVHTESDTVPMRLLNLSANAVTIYKGKNIAEMETKEPTSKRQTQKLYLPSPQDVSKRQQSWSTSYRS